MSTCNTDLIRDYAFEEIAAADRPALERHLADCADCAAELDRLRLTTAALRVLPDVEPPQRIAFVSDKVFERPRLSSFWFLKAEWLGFASAAVMAAALIFTVSHRPVEVRTVEVRPAPVQPAGDIVQKAVAQAQEADARVFKAALAASEARHEQQYRTLMDDITYLQLHQGANTIMASNELPPNGNGQ